MANETKRERRSPMSLELITEKALALDLEAKIALVKALKESIKSELDKTIQQAENAKKAADGI